MNDNNEVTFNVSDVIIPPSDQVKLLGLKIDKKLNFESHIGGICKKASWHIGAIARIAKFLDKQCKMKLYNAFVRSNVQYCNIIWHFLQGFWYRFLVDSKIKDIYEKSGKNRKKIYDLLKDEYDIRL